MRKLKKRYKKDNLQRKEAASNSKKKKSRFFNATMNEVNFYKSVNSDPVFYFEPEDFNDEDISERNLYIRESFNSLTMDENIFNILSYDEDIPVLKFKLGEVF